MKNELVDKIKVISEKMVSANEEVEKLAKKSKKSGAISLLDACTCTGNCDDIRIM